MQSKFGNKVALPKKTHESQFYNFPELIFSITSTMQTFTNFGQEFAPNQSESERSYCVSVNLKVIKEERLTYKTDNSQTNYIEMTATMQPVMMQKFNNIFSRMQQKKTCLSLVGLCFLGVQVFSPHQWKQFLGLISWWSQQVWGKWDNVVVCLRSSVMFKVILQTEKA
jgi:hypothetical protein